MQLDLVMVVEQFEAPGGADGHASPAATASQQCTEMGAAILKGSSRSERPFPHPHSALPAAQFGSPESQLLVRSRGTNLVRAPQPLPRRAGLPP